MTVDKNYDLGCRLPADDWLWLNGRAIFDDPLLRPYVAPFPPEELMTNVSGLTNDRDFASHGVDIFRALMQASPKPITDYRDILDFGCGCGRLIRMFKEHPNRIVGCDIDKRYVNWVAGNLGYMTACLTSVNPPLPFGDDEFDVIISISIFTPLSEKNHDDFLISMESPSFRNGTFSPIGRNGFMSWKSGVGQYIIFRISLYCDPGNETVLQDAPTHIHCQNSIDTQDHSSYTLTVKKQCLISMNHHYESMRTYPDMAFNRMLCKGLTTSILPQFEKEPPVYVHGICTRSPCP